MVRVDFRLQQTQRFHMSVINLLILIALKLLALTLLTFRIEFQLLAFTPFPEDSKKLQ